MDAAISVPVDLTSGVPAATTTADLAKRGKIEKTSKDFEASFLNIMYQQMFEGVGGADAAFGGGAAEDMWKSFMTDAMARQTVKRGGIGLAHTVEKEMLKLQGLSA
jgi:Rod binding domain-containing protein